MLVLTLTAPAVLAQSVAPGARNRPSASPITNALTSGSAPVGGYLLGAGDRVRVDIFNVPEYSGEFPILADGTVNLPLAGAVLVRDMTLQQAAAAISSRYVSILRRPAVTVSLLQTRPITVAIVGEVNRPGPYTLTPDASGGSIGSSAIPTVTQAIEQAGGITQLADIRSVEVRRRSPAGTQEIIPLDFWQLLQEGDLSQDLLLQAGDTIVIPTATALDPSEITELASSSFSADAMTVNIVGEVARPGAVEVAPNTPLNQALLAAGGFNTRARRGTVQLIRLNPDGTVSQQAIAVDFTQGLNSASNPSLRPNDTIVVGRSSLANISDTIGPFVSSFTGVFGILRLLGL
ncbi:MAG TPA: SLBB domain-containing protein [Chroococcidiopsis sp.]